MSENLVEPSVIAKAFNFEGVRRIDQLVQDGIITPTIQKVNGRSVRRYDFIPTVCTYIKYLQDKLKHANKSEKELELKEQKLAAEIALKESQGELHRLKTAITSGKYISIDEIKLDYARFFINFKKFATSMPSRLTGSLYGVLDPLEIRKIEKEMSKDITDLIASFVVAGVVRPTDVKRILKDAEEAQKMEEEV